MKIEVDLNDILFDEDGVAGETAEESIRRQIIDRLSGDLRKRMFARLDEQLSQIMREQIAEVMKDQMPAIMDDIMNAEYTPVSTYGQSSAPTNFRAEIVKSVVENMKYQPKQFQSDENAFTRGVRSVMDAKTAEIKKELIAQIDTDFRKDAISYAVTELSKRLGLTK